MRAIELIEWRDASNDTEGWQSDDALDDDNCIIRSVGFVVKETDNNLTLAMDEDESGHTNGRGRIPKSLIISRKVLHESD